MNSVYFAVAGLLALVATALGAPMDVIVVDAKSNLAYRGRLAADGSFSTGTLRPGNYVVQFNARGGVPRENYAIVVGAGRNKVVAESVNGGKFADGGVAMRVKVPSGARIVGHVATGGAEAAGVKIINGRRYVLAFESIGSHLGARWVEEGTKSSRNIIYWDREAVQEMQDRGSAQGM